ncbi:hypothetical protein HHI36_001803 [Cryptolaemus montrouzieri]|uniref:Uncharacterized protein n=1 Tax=Cryptolaemus montrouzieri TaxID=559131 RepID=A0ABD2P8P0_9CUCU
MSPLCKVCSGSIEDKPICCDSCHIAQHPTEAYTGLCSSELRAVVLLKRTMFYFCQNYRVSFKSIPMLLREMQAFKAEILSVKNEVEVLKEEIGELRSENVSIKDEIAQLKNNSQTAVNSSGTNMDQNQENAVGADDRRKDDLNAVRNLLGGCNVDLQNLQVIRIEKVSPNKNRLTKVIMKSKLEVVEMLRNKQSIPQVNKVFRDQTIKQKDYYMKIKNELQDLISKGDNSKTIKFINEIPTIVMKKHAKNKKNSLNILVTNTRATLNGFAVSNIDLCTRVHNEPKLTDQSLVSVSVLDDILYDSSALHDYYRNLSAVNIDRICLGLMENDYMLRCVKPDLFYGDFVLKTEYVVNRVAPLQSGKAVHSTKLSWYDFEVKFQAKLRDVVFRVCRENKTNNNWNTHKMAGNTTLHLLRRKKRDNYFNKIDMSSGNPKLMWRTIKSIIGSGCVCRNGADGIDFVIDGRIKTVRKPIEVANLFNNYFEESLESIVGSINIVGDCQDVVNCRTSFSNFK